MGQVTYFHGIEFTWRFSSNSIVSVSLIPQSFAEKLIDSVGYTTVSIFYYTYQSGLPIVI
jgi:hypothetical protein